MFVHLGYGYTSAGYSVNISRSAEIVTSLYVLMYVRRSEDWVMSVSFLVLVARNLELLQIILFGNCVVL